MWYLSVTSRSIVFETLFQDRIVCMTLDRESDVCVEAIKLVGLFFR